jgi:hypothetical protein
MWATEIRNCEDCGKEFPASKFTVPKARFCKDCIGKRAGVGKREPYSQDRGRISPVVDSLLPEFEQVMSQYTDEKIFIHTKYVSQFIRKNPEQYPLLNKYQPDYALNRKVNQCFARRDDFELHRLTRGRHAGPIWKRIDIGGSGSFSGELP